MKTLNELPLRSKGLEDLLALNKSYVGKYQEAVRRVENLSPGKLNNTYQKEYCSWKNRKKWAKDNATEWYAPMNDFFGFLLVNGPIPFSGWTLDRINPEGDYTPENMRWASKTTQSQNRTTARLIDVNGQEFTMTELAHRTGLTYDAIRMGMNRHGKDFADKLDLNGNSCASPMTKALKWKFPEEHSEELERMYVNRRVVAWLRPRFYAELISHEIEVHQDLLFVTYECVKRAEIVSDLALLKDALLKIMDFIDSVNSQIFFDDYNANIKEHFRLHKVSVDENPDPHFDRDYWFLKDDGTLPWSIPPSGENPVFNLFG